MLLRPKNARQSKSKVKVMLIIFFDVKGIVHCEFLSHDLTDLSASLQGDSTVFASLNAREEKNCVSRTNRSCFITITHLPTTSRELRHTGITSLVQCDFFLFPKLEGIIKGTCFEGVEAIKRAVTT